MTPGTVRRMTLAVGLGLLLALALASTVALAQGGSPPSGGYDYTVQPGDSWLTLSGRTNIPIADLKAANPAAQHPYGWLWQGERLFIPARTAPTPGRQASPTPSATAAGYWYQVQKGDTWQTVARASGVPMLDLWHANPLQLRPNRWLYIGHRLWIPKAASYISGCYGRCTGRNRRASRNSDARAHAYRSAYRNPGSTLVCGDSHADQGRCLACGDPHGRGHRDQTSGHRGRNSHATGHWHRCDGDETDCATADLHPAEPRRLAR